MELKPAPKGTKQIKFGILIVCEDSRGNFQYIKDKVSSCQPKTSSTKIDFEFGNSEDAEGPQVQKLIHYAINRIKELNEQYYNGGEEPEEHFYKKMYCVSDVDENYSFSNIPPALAILQQAREENKVIEYELLFSNECFEIWYILHFQDITQPLYRGTKEQEISGLWKEDKSNDIKQVLKSVTNVGIHSQKTYTAFFTLMQENGNEQDAIQRAKNLEANALAKGNIYELTANPSTEVYKLIEMLNNL
jgi:hypothetical protein